VKEEIEFFSEVTAHVLKHTTITAAPAVTPSSASVQVICEKGETILL